MKENKENTLKVIGQNIKRIRLLKNQTQEGLAEMLDKSINFISLIERGESGIAFLLLLIYVMHFKSTLMNYLMAW